MMNAEATRALPATITRRAFHALHREERRRAVWFALDRAALVWGRCAACGQTGVAPQQPLEDVVFCADCLDRGRSPRGEEYRELGVAG